MYCGKCGNKIIDGDSFCRNCGFNISIENYTTTSTEYTSDIDINMKWYNFYTYFLLPFSLIVNIFLILGSYDYINFLLLLSLIWFVYLGITFAFLLFKKKIGYYLNIALIISNPIIVYCLNIINLAYEDIAYGIAYTIGFMIFALPWSILNLLYFKKRKILFH